TSNFSFYSKDSKIRYQLSSLPNYGSPQLLQSYFWYAYQKAFLQAGLNAGADCREEDIPELWIILQSFNDEELQFKITLLKNRETAYEKDLVVTPAPASSRNHTALQKHAYDITDLTVVKILDDPGFQDVMLKYGK
ncbi:MAG TPA: hypothetical protein PKZ12_05935, partial [Smithellaceae bacterium]|nr:hypothetical protein [Smithellaceae bacterium]